MSVGYFYMSRVELRGRVGSHHIWSERGRFRLGWFDLHTVVFHDGVAEALSIRCDTSEKSVHVNHLDQVRSGAIVQLSGNLRRSMDGIVVDVKNLTFLEEDASITFPGSPEDLEEARRVEAEKRYREGRLL